MATLAAPTMRSVPVTLAQQVQPATTPVPVHVVVRWALYLLAFSLPFEMPNRQIVPVEVPTLTAALFLCTTGLQPRVAYGRIPAALVWFFACLYAYGLAAVVNGTDYGAEVIVLLLLLLQGILVFWAAANLLRNEGVARGTLVSLGLACAALALLSLAGIGRTSHVVYTGGERLTVFGQNANNTAMVLATGAIAVAGLAYVLVPSWPRQRWLAWPLAGLVGLAIIDTGSRGGLLALSAGLLAFMLGGRTAWLRIRNVSIGVLALGTLVGASYNSTLMRNRLEVSAEGNFAGREAIFPGLIQMSREKPLLGWGPVTNKYELGIRLHEIKHHRRDAHNVLLEVLSATGVVGLIPFLIAVALCTLAAWRARQGHHGILPAAVLVVVLVANMSGNRIANKIFWIACAYAVAATTYAPAGRRDGVRLS